MKIAIGISTLNNGIYQVQEKIRSLPENIIVIISHKLSRKYNHLSKCNNKEELYQRTKQK